MPAKNTALPQATLIQSQGRLLSLEKPVVMGILNATPDSFFAPSRAHSLRQMADRAGDMLEQGAAILDIGGASSRPGARPVGEAEELDRVVPAVESVVQAFPHCWVSVDTTSAAVARAAAAAGAAIINDISGGAHDAGMLPTVAALRLPFVAMHMQGTPQTMQQAPHYEAVVTEVLDYLAACLHACTQAGITDVILDPGFGFGKTTAHNYQLLAGLSALRILGRPLLAGISRKRMICEPLGIRPDAALNGTTAAHMIALQQGATILRAHDVREAAEAIQVFGLVGTGR